MDTLIMYLSYILRSDNIMNMKKSMTLVLMGVGGTLLYQQIRNGNAKKCIKDMEKMLKKEFNDLEDMM